MPKLILRCNYLKNIPAPQLQNFIQYLGTRDGVEKVSSTNILLPATAKQEDLIREITGKISDTKKMHEYHDYMQNPTRENASEFIAQALENHIDLIAQKKNYIDYLANRPRAEKVGTHGLFSDEGKAVVLSQAADEIAHHSGIIWTNVLSLRREDAERLGYDRASEWQHLIRSRLQLFANNFKIENGNFKWYAAFHNESHHPHVHLVIYAADPDEGYLTKKGIDTIRSTLAHDIFRQDFMSLYEQKTEMRQLLKKQAENSLLFLMDQIQQGYCHNEMIAEKIDYLSQRLKNANDRKVFGYLRSDLKAIVNTIVDELAKEEKVAACYQKWLYCQEEVYRFYKDTPSIPVPLSEQPELKSIKNMVIREAVKLGNKEIFFDDRQLTESENQEEVRQMAIEESAEPEDDIGDTLSALFESLPDTTFFVNNEITSEDDHENQEAPNDFQEAAYQIMKEEAGSGNALALFDMGKMYRQGIFVEPDEAISQEWYAQSLSAFLTAVKKYAPVSKNKKGIPSMEYLQYRIGKHYQRGLGTKVDNLSAASWFKKAADCNHKYAQYSLALLFLHGQGVEQNNTEAFHLMQKSNLQVNPYASYELAKICVRKKKSWLKTHNIL